MSTAETSIRMEVKVEGLPEVQKWMDTKFKDLLREASNEATDKTLDDAVRKAQSIVPVDTGALRKSIRKERLARPKGFFTYQGFRAGGHVRNPRTGRMVDYAKFVEYGTSRMYPRPYMRPAMKYATQRFKAHFRTAWNRRRPR